MVPGALAQDRGETAEVVDRRLDAALGPPPGRDDAAVRDERLLDVHQLGRRDRRRRERTGHLDLAGGDGAALVASHPHQHVTPPDQQGHAVTHDDRRSTVRIEVVEHLHCGVPAWVAMVHDAHGRPRHAWAEGEGRRRLRARDVLGGG